MMQFQSITINIGNQDMNQPQSCTNCETLSEEILMLACSHDLCLNCAAQRLDFLMKNLKPGVSILCEFCYESTPLDRQIIRELEKFIPSKRSEGPSQLQKLTEQPKGVSGITSKYPKSPENLTEVIPLDKIGSFKTLKILGNGSYGTVYLVQSANKDKYAIKLISAINQNKKVALKEAEMYLTLKHANILKGYDYFALHNNNIMFIAIVLEYYPEGSLSNFIGKLDQKQIKRIMKDIINGLAYMHELKIIHRDIKPQNILMKKGNAIIADLSTARVVTSTGATKKVGSPFYMAPEISVEEYYDQDPSSSSVDIWSLGIVFFELLTGKTISEIVGGGYLKPSLRKDFPSAHLELISDENMRELVSMMLQKDPKKRLSAKDVAIFLESDKFPPSVQTGKIDTRQQIKYMNEKQLIQLFSQNLQFPNLKVIQLNGCKITDKGFQSLVNGAKKDFDSLQQIWLNDNQISDKGLEAFAQQAKKFIKLQKIYLGNNQITDEGLKKLANAADKFKSLEQITLSDNSKVTIAGLKSTVGATNKFPKLKIIFFLNNKVPNNSRKLQQSNTVGCVQF